jgi:site-specific recombinase XerD
MSEPEGSYHLSPAAGGGALGDPQGQLALALRQLAASDLAPNTQRGYRRSLSDLYGWLGDRDLTPETLEAHAAHLRQQRGLAPATVNMRLAAARWWARRLAELALAARALPPDERQALALQAARAAGVRDLAADAVATPRAAAADLDALLAACRADPEPAGLRDAALVALALATGLRRSELARLTLGDLAVTQGGYLITVRTLQGDVSRRVALRGGAARYLGDWLALRAQLRPAPRDRAEPDLDCPDAPLFLAVRRGGALAPHGLGPQAVYERLKQRAAQAGAPDLTWEAIRRGVAYRLLAEGADLAAVQRLLGHASPASTGAYAPQGPEIAEAADVPY